MIIFKPMDIETENRFAQTHSCQFEEWDSKKGEMGVCGKPAYGYVGKQSKSVCFEHYEHVKGKSKNVHESIFNKAQIKKVYA